MKRMSILMLLVVWDCNAQTDAPTSQQTFIEAYRSAYEGGRREELLRLVKWNGVPDDLRRTQEIMYSWFLGKHKIVSIELVPFKLGPGDTQEVDGRPTELNLDAKYWLLVDHEGNEGYEDSKSSGSIKAPVGIEGGAFFICGTKWADNQQ